MMNAKTIQNSDVQGWLRALAPWVLMALGLWYFMGGVEANQVMSTKQLDRIEAKMTGVEANMNDMRVTIGEMKKDIEYLKRCDR